MGPAVTVHEVTPGHFAHGRMLRQLVRGDVRRSLFSEAFVEGWACYAEELMVEQGFRADDPRFASGVYLNALVGVTGLGCALGIHRGTMTVDEIMSLRDQTLAAWGTTFSLRRFHEAYSPSPGRRESDRS